MAEFSKAAQDELKRLAKEKKEAELAEAAAVKARADAEVEAKRKREAERTAFIEGLRANDPVRARIGGGWLDACVSAALRKRGSDFVVWVDIGNGPLKAEDVQAVKR